MRFARFPALAALLVLAAACSDPSGSTDGKQTEPDPKPTPQTEAVHYASISAGEGVTCGLSTAGVAYCWGNGMLRGSARADTTGTPRRVDGSATFAQISSAFFTCARTAAGDVSCWGADNQTPQPMYASRGLKVASVTSPTNSYSAACGIQPSHALACWLPHDSVAYAPGPYRDVAPLSNCLLDEAGQILCTQHPLIDYHPWYTFRPTFVAGDSLSAFTSISGGSSSACALRTDGAAVCSTQSSFGCCGSAWLGGFAAVPGGHTFTQVSAANVRACGLDASGAAWCWTQGASYGENHPISAPVQVNGAPPFVQISVSAAHACGVTAGGDAYCWGDNALGQLGGGTIGGSSAVPVKVVDAVTP